MNKFNLRRLFENMISFVVLDTNIILKELIVPGYYIAKSKTLRISSTKDGADLVKITYAALIHHLHPKTSLETCLEYAGEMTLKINKSEMQWAIKYIRDHTIKLSIV